MPYAIALSPARSKTFKCPRTIAAGHLTAWGLANEWLPVKLAWETDDRNGWDAVCEELDLRDRREDGRLKSDKDDLELLVVDEGLSGGLYTIRTVRG